MGHSVEELKDRVCRKVDAEHPALIALSDRIHAHPELRFEEHRASAWLADYLDDAGFSVERCAYGLATAFAARAGRGRPRVAILCEYDALPGIGHGCGHNLIAAAGAGAASGLSAVLGDVEGSLVVLGTPAEEGGGGKILMARQGAFADVDAAMMIHPAGMDLVSMRVLAISALEVEYRGRAAHAAAAPHCGVNALDGLVTAYNSIAQLRQHIRSDERIHGIITDGGQAPNIVPERAMGVFFVRAATEKRLERLKRRVEGCFQAGAAASGAAVSIRKLGEDYVDLITNVPLAGAYGENLARLGRTVRTDVPSVVTGSTDMGNVSKMVPSLHPMIAVSPPNVALHSHEFAEWAASEAGHRAVADGAKVLAMTALDVICNADLRAAMQASFEADVGGAAAATG